MKKQFMMTVAAIMATMSLQAQTDIDLDSEAMYFDIDDLPNAVVWLPAPPDTTSTQFVYDITQYMWGKQQRLDEERAQQAIDNAVEEVSDMLEQFSVPFGMELSKENTPAIYHVLYRGMLTVRLCATKPKTTYMRKRPSSIPLPVFTALTVPLPSTTRMTSSLKMAKRESGRISGEVAA